MRFKNSMERWYTQTSKGIHPWKPSRDSVIVYSNIKASCPSPEYGHQTFLRCKWSNLTHEVRCMLFNISHIKPPCGAESITSTRCKCVIGDRRPCDVWIMFCLELSDECDKNDKGDWERVQRKSLWMKKIPLSWRWIFQDVHYSTSRIHLGLTMGSSRLRQNWCPCRGSLAASKEGGPGGLHQPWFSRLVLSVGYVPSIYLNRMSEYRRSAFGWLCMPARSVWSRMSQKPDAIIIDIVNHIGEANPNVPQKSKSRYQMKR